MLQQFKVFRAIGLAFKAWFRNFIPFTLLAALLYSPLIAWAVMLPGADDATLENWHDIENQYETFLTRGAYLFVGIAALLAPLILYRVIEDMNGRRVSFGTSLKLGLRGIIPAAILGAVRLGLSMIPLGALVGLVLVCTWFVVAPAAVAERLGPIAAFKRSGELTAGRRVPIFGMLFLMGIVQAVVLLAIAMPLFSSHETDPQVVAHLLKRAAIIFVVLVAVSELFTAIVQAVSYALLRADKDGVSTEDLAKVFE